MSESIYISTARFTKIVGVLKPFPLSLADTFDAGIWRPWDRATLFQDLAMQQPVTAADQAVRVISDVSGNGYHWVAPTDARRGFYRESGGNFAGIDMAGDKGYNLSGDALGLLSGVDQAMMCLAFNADGINTYRTLCRFNTDSNDVRMAISTAASAGQLNGIARRVPGEASATATVSRPSGLHVYSAVADFLAGVSRLHVDHGLIEAQGEGMVAGKSGAGAANGAYLGHYDLSGSSFSNARFYGGMILSGATVELVRLSVEQYLADNIGVALGS